MSGADPNTSTVRNEIHEGATEVRENLETRSLVDASTHL